MKKVRNLASVAMIFISAIATAYNTAAQQRFSANLSPLQTLPASSSTARGNCTAGLSDNDSRIDVGCWLYGLPVGGTAGLYRSGGPGQIGTLVQSLELPPNATSLTMFAATGENLKPSLLANQWYIQITTIANPTGELRGQLKLPNGTYNDYDGDGRTDIQLYRQSANIFFALRSTDGGYIEQPLGQPGDSVSLTVDWDGDGLSDFSVARYAAQAVWRILPSTTGILEETPWGSSSLGDFFAAGDYDGDGKFDIAVFRAGVWYILESSTGNVRYEYWGQSGDVPATNDYDGDGKADLTISRSEGGQRYWWIKNSSNGEVSMIPWGLSNDGFFTGRADFDGDGKADLMVIRSEGGQRVYYIRQSSNGALRVATWGLSSDVVKLGDYDGDGKTDLAVTRAVSGQRVFFIQQSSNGAMRTETFGLQGDF